MSRHDAARASWQPGQIWETRNDECADDPAAWVPVGDGGRAQPLWDPRQEYRRREDPRPPRQALAIPVPLNGVYYLPAQVEAIARAMLRLAVGACDCGDRCSCPPGSNARNDCSCWHPAEAACGLR